MILRRLRFDPFMRYESFDRTFPDRGVVLVVGDNGSGKSTLVEGVAWALHGELVRGSKLSKPARVVLDVDLGGRVFAVERRRNGQGHVSVLLREGAEGSADAGGVTATETQAKIDVLAGRWQRWVATTVFSREVMARFGAATDKDRKGLLEQMLGLGRFNAALVAARGLVKERAQAAADARAREALLAGKLEGLRAADDGATAGDLEAREKALAATQEQADAARDAASGKWKDVRDRATEVGVELGRVNHARVQNRERAEAVRRAVEAMERAARRLDPGATCPVCRRVLTDGAARDVEAHFLAEAERERAELGKLDRDLILIDGDVDDLQRAYGDLRVEAVAAEREWREASTEAEKIERDLHVLRARLELLRGRGAQVREVEREHGEAAAALGAAGRLLAEAEACVEVFGLQGARNALLGRSLARLERETNVILGRLGTGLRVRVTGTTALKSGKEVEKVGVEVDGAGDGDYRGASAGERARLDVAFLLGLAALRGEPGGVIFFDEVFDALDFEGVERVAELLSDMGTERQVVVVTHRADLASRFPQGAIWRVKDGAITG